MKKEELIAILKKEPFIDVNAKIRPDHIIREVVRHMENEDPDRIKSVTETVQHAIGEAFLAHKGVLRKSGEPYIYHPLTVAYFLAYCGMDADCVVAGLLHDTVEDSSTTIKEIEEKFGKSVAYIVDGVTKLPEIQPNREEKQASAIKKLFTYAEKDPRVFIIKLFDRLHNIITLDAMPEEKRERIALETLKFYVPLAHRLGLYWVKDELEQIAFYYANNDDWRQIDAYVSMRYENLKESEEAVIGKTRSCIMETTPQLADKIAKIYCEVKSYYAIYRSTLMRGLPVDSVKNIVSVRIVLKSDDILDCYSVLAGIHNYRDFIVVPKQFKDYIASPKPDGYQSIHTLVRNCSSKNLVKFQICTEKMECFAKEGPFVYGDPEAHRNAIANWLKEINEELSDESSAPAATVYANTLENNIKFEKNIVFTPQGDEIAMPDGATLLDFAFKIHSDYVGARCIGGFVNHKRATISYVLQNMDEVEIETDKNQVPREDWLDVAKTQYAKKHIRRFLQKEQFQSEVARGREKLKPLFVSQGYEKYFENLREQPEFLDLAAKYELPKDDALNSFFSAVWTGKIGIGEVLTTFFSSAEIENLKRAFPRIVAPVFSDGGEQLRPVYIKGIGEISDYTCAECCTPVEGDDVIAVGSEAGGYTIHKRLCAELLKEMEEEQERQKVEQDEESEGRPKKRFEKDVYWIDYPKYEITFIVSLKNRKGSLSELVNELSENNFNITSLHLSSSNAADTAGDVNVTVRGSNIQSVDSLQRSLEAHKSIIGFKISKINDRG